MESNDKIEWRAPAIVTQQRQEEAKSLMRLLVLRAWPLITIAIAIIILIAITITHLYGSLVFGEDSPKFINGLLMLGLGFVAVFLFIMTVPLLPSVLSRKSEVYVMNEKGLYDRSYGHGSNTSWRRLKDYHFTDHQELAGIRVLEFTANPIKYIGDKEHQVQFYFDPQDVKEETLKSFIERHIVA